MISSASSPINNPCNIPRSYGSISRPYLMIRNKVDSSLFSNLAQRLRFRKDLHLQRKAIALFCLIFALIGLILTMLEIELSIIYGFPLKKTNFYFWSFIMKSLITATTLVLLCSIVAYHFVDGRIQMQKYNIEDHNLMINYPRIFKLLIEIIICSFHPLVGVNEPLFPTKGHRFAIHSIDGIMSILMFLRFYLLVRVLILWSDLHQDTLAQSFGAINQTTLNTNFIFKSWINLYAGYVLIIMTLMVVFWGGWSLRVCEMHGSPYFLTFSNSLWLTGVTFLTIGYGDIIPYTICGKIVAVLIGALGAGCTALVVAIVASKLELTQSEKYLYNFVQDSQLTARLKRLSADIVKNAWKLHKLRKSQDQDSKKKTSLMYYQRKLQLNLRLVRQIRTEKRHLLDSSISIMEVNRAQLESHSLLENLNEKIFNIERVLSEINMKLEKY